MPLHLRIPQTSLRDSYHQQPSMVSSTSTESPVYTCFFSKVMSLTIHSTPKSSKEPPAFPLQSLWDKGLCRWPSKLFSIIFPQHHMTVQVRTESQLELWLPIFHLYPTQPSLAPFLMDSRGHQPATARN